MLLGKKLSWFQGEQPDHMQVERSKLAITTTNKTASLNYFRYDRTTVGHGNRRPH